ncbi:MAG TPA: phasin family protein [Stellaceae bacterium]|nr:phasin family protein [Stellaceae bacterium]
MDQPTARLFAWPLEMMLRFNANVANAIQENTVSWAQRRQQAAEDAVETFERLVHCRDIGEAVSIQQEWVENNIRRLDEDFGALAHQGATLSRRAASTARDAVGKSANVARAGARQAEETADSMRHEGQEAEQSAQQETEESHRHGRGRNHKRAA